jgi:hypothetical protein
MTGDDARALLARTPLVVRRGPFALASWTPAQASAVSSAALRSNTDIALWMLDDREVTALLRETALGHAPPPRQAQKGWALLTLDQSMEWDVTGVLAAVSSALAAAGIPIGAVTAFARDHVLVPGERLEDALAALAGVCGEVRRLD